MERRFSCIQPGCCSKSEEHKKSIDKIESYFAKLLIAIETWLTSRQTVTTAGPETINDAVDLLNDEGVIPPVDEITSQLSEKHLAEIPEYDIDYFEKVYRLLPDIFCYNVQI